MIITTGKLLGILTATLVIMAMHRMIIRVSNPVTDPWFRKYPRLFRVKKAMAGFMLRNHSTFGRLAFLSALVHGGYVLWSTGRPSLTGMVVLLFLTVQVILGNLRVKLPWAGRVHRFLPYGGLLVLILHVLIK